MLKSVLELKDAIKLERKELKTIQDGRMKCKDEYGKCIKFGSTCAELECAWSPFD